jgi:hypothetical protein
MWVLSRYCTGKAQLYCAVTTGWTAPHPRSPGVSVWMTRRSNWFNTVTRCRGPSDACHLNRLTLPTSETGNAAQVAAASTITDRPIVGLSLFRGTWASIRCIECAREHLVVNWQRQITTCGGLKSQRRRRIHDVTDHMLTTDFSPWTSRGCTS